MGEREAKGEREVGMLRQQGNKGGERFGNYGRGVRRQLREKRDVLEVV